MIGRTNITNFGVIIGGDFNVAPNPSLDCQGGNPVQKDSFNQIKDLSLSNDLVDIWRIRNPDLIYLESKISFHPKEAGLLAYK